MNSDKLPMNSDELTEWVEAWNNKYDPRWDDQIAVLRDKSELRLCDLRALYDWKLRRLWPERAKRSLESWPEEDIQQLSRRAINCNDEMGAVRLFQMLPGSGPSVASAILAAIKPDDFTVMDVRALSSLITLGCWPEDHGDHASAWYYPKYISVCRAIRDVLDDPIPAADRTLRTVDRALFAANGAGELPH
ncbi:MAG: hypothetical protein ACYDEY_13800 [Acidimicrobiales bacterium]